jgi:hypothetical protein
VGPDDLGVFMQGEFVGQLSRAELLKSARVLRDKPIDPLDLNPHFPSQGALGVYVNSGRASFRQVTVKPLAEKN